MISRPILTLALAETLIWATTFYMFPALLPTWESELGWDKRLLSGAFTVALLVSAVLSPLAGRLIDKGHGRVVLAGSTLIACLGLAGLASVTQPWQFYLAWAMLGVAMSGALYEACFAFVVWLVGIRSRQAITTITLVAGLAGTASFPSVHWLVGLVGWRNCLWLFALVALVVILPLFVSVPTRRVASSEEHHQDSTSSYSIADALRSPLFWLLALAFAGIALEHGILISHLLPILHDRGISPDQAVFYAACIGPMQVFGRLLMIAVQVRVSMMAIAMLSSFLAMIGVVSLKLAITMGVLAMAFVLIHGASYGVSSITRPVITMEMMGRQNFGAISGMIGSMFMAMTALAPILAALLWGVGGYDLVLWFAILICMFSFVCLYLLQRRARIT